MKLSKLRSFCDKAIEKYGDIGLGVYSACDSYDVTDGSEAFQNLSFRVVHDQKLPGESLEEEEQSIKQSEPTAVLFYS